MLKAAVGVTPVDADYGRDAGQQNAPVLVDLGGTNRADHQGTAEQP